MSTIAAAVPETAKNALLGWARFGVERGAEHLERAESGLINQTWTIRDLEGRPTGVLQRLNTAIFTPRVHEDIAAVTAHLAAKGLATPRLVPTDAGKLWWWENEDGVWRRFDWIGDRTIEKVIRPEDAAAAGRLVGRFHKATEDFDWEFRSARGGFHDTPLRMKQLRTVLEKYPNHRLFTAVKPLAKSIFDHFTWLREPAELPRRVVHGDLKISNIRFQNDEALALIDLDTLAWGTLDAELGDAFRSWCNSSSEDDENPTFSIDIFAAGLRGYAETSNPTDPEWEALVDGVERITLELSARFAADALEEKYFGFHAKYGGCGEHNLLRATGQFRLAQSLRAQRSKADALVQQIRAR